MCAIHIQLNLSLAIVEGMEIPQFHDSREMPVRPLQYGDAAMLLCKGYKVLETRSKTKQNWFFCTVANHSALPDRLHVLGLFVSGANPNRDSSVNRIVTQSRQCRQSNPVSAVSQSL